MAADGVADDLDERVHVDVVELPLEAGLRVGLAHEAPRRRRVEAALEPALELRAVEREEVRALLPLDVDHLDELARSHLVRERGRRVDADVEARLGERRRELVLLVGSRRRCAAPRRGARTGEGRRRRCVLRARPRRPSPRGRPGTPATSPEATTRRRAGPPSPPSGSSPRAASSRQSSEPSRSRSASRITVAGASAVAPSAAASSREPPSSTRELGHLPAVLVDHGQPLVRAEREHGRAARPHEVRLEERVLGEQPAHERSRSSRHAPAGAFASISAASAMSFSASSRFPSASSFLTSFSTARRLYVWFQ